MQSPRVRMASVGDAYMASGLVSGTETGGSVTSRTCAAIAGTNTATSGTTSGVHGVSTSTSGYGVYSGGLAGSGSRSCVVETSKGPTLLYCQESPEDWFEDFGEGQLGNDRCHVVLGPVFLEAVTIDQRNPMKVSVELSGRCRGI